MKNTLFILTLSLTTAASVIIMMCHESFYEYNMPAHDRHITDPLLPSILERGYQSHLLTVSHELTSSFELISIRNGICLYNLLPVDMQEYSEHTERLRCGIECQSNEPTIFKADVINENHPSPGRKFFRQELTKFLSAVKLALI